VGFICSQNRRFSGCAIGTTAQSPWTSNATIREQSDFSIGQYFDFAYDPVTSAIPSCPATS
jgi:hypothetical protein